MKRLIRVSSTILAIAAFAAPALHAQTGEDAFRFAERAPATGARAMGMAGVGIAGIADYSAFFTNPAGLGYLQASLFGGSLNSLSVTDEARYQTIGFTSFGESDVRATHLGNLAYVYKVPTSRGSLVVGAGYNQADAYDRSLQFAGQNAANSVSDSFLPFADEFEVAFDDAGPFPHFFHDVPELAFQGGAIEFLSENVGTDQPLFYQAVVPGTTIEQFGDVLEEGRMSELNVGGAWEASPNVMVGLSGNFSFGTYRFNSIFEESDSQNENGPDDYIVVLSDGELRGFDFLTYEQGFESDLTGFSLRGGVSTDVAGGARLGLTVETPTFFVVNEDFHRSVETIFDIGGSLSESQRGEFEYEIRTPWRLGAGAAWHNGDILIAGDVEYVDWSQMELDADGTSFDDVNRDIRQSFDPVWNAKIGAEYLLGNVALRGGFAIKPDPRVFEQGADQTFDRDKTFFSAGVGYQFADRFFVDLGWMQERFDDQYVPYGDVSTTPPVAEEEVVRNRVSIGVRVMF